VSVVSPVLSQPVRLLSGALVIYLRRVCLYGVELIGSPLLCMWWWFLLKCLSYLVYWSLVFPTYWNN
jgi:hypothetical protein